jgi:hypothetical protein
MSVLVLVHLQACTFMLLSSLNAKHRRQSEILSILFLILLGYSFSSASDQSSILESASPQLADSFSEFGMTTKDGEIVGLKASNNGRSCVSHDCCGIHLNLDDLVRFRFTIIEREGRTEQAVKAVQIRDGTETCTVGFLPTNIVQVHGDKYIDKFAQIIELYDCSESEVKKRKSQRNCGIASFRLLDDIPKQE